MPAVAEPQFCEVAAETAEVVDQLRELFLCVKARVQSSRGQAGVTASQAQVLACVNDTPGLGVGELARQLGLHQSTISNLLGPLVAQGLLASLPRADDGRGVQLRITAPGRRLLRRLPHPFNGVLASAIAQMDGRARKRLGRDLQDLVRLLEAADAGD